MEITFLQTDGYQQDYSDSDDEEDLNAAENQIAQEASVTFSKEEEKQQMRLPYKDSLIVILPCLFRLPKISPISN